MRLLTKMLLSWAAPSSLKPALRQMLFQKDFARRSNGNRTAIGYCLGMPQLSISEVARTVGLRPSAIRYYEQIGILPPVKRIRGQRRYGPTDLSHLVVIQRARQNGFTLDEIRELFFGFDRGTGPAARWQKLSERKLAELEVSIEQIKNVQRRLSQLRDGCRCNTLEECGAGFLQH
jgi:MerR family redox-sensitive transcriptional activator SoxR